jgi:hypothetical protein
MRVTPIALVALALVALVTPPVLAQSDPPGSLPPPVPAAERPREPSLGERAGATASRTGNRVAAGTRRTARRTGAAAGRAARWTGNRLERAGTWTRDRAERITR